MTLAVERHIVIARRVIDGDEKDSYKGASLRGRAEEVTDAYTRAKLYDAFGKKYFGAVEHSKFIKIHGQADDGIFWEY